MAKFKKVLVKNLKGISKPVKQTKPKKSRKRKSIGKRKQLSNFKKLTKMYGKKIVNRKGKWISL